MDDLPVCLVWTSVDSREVAQALARSAVCARLAACAQVVAGADSVYWWSGEVQSTREWLVTFKTTLARYPALEEHLRAAHPYDVPEIICLRVEAGNPAYLRWVREQTQL
jgi:periplasmic divalent cation tolerance protein